MAARRRFIVANWKMNVGLDAARDFLRDLPAHLPEDGHCEIAIAPSFPHLSSLASVVHAGGHRLFAQNCHHAPAGAHTGEVSVAMLRELEVDGVIIGHSERRQEFGESDDLIAAKLAAVLDGGLSAILCVGETLAEREEGLTAAVLGRQVESGLSELSGPAEPARLTVAYEPVWAIGTGRTASLAQVEEAVAIIHASLSAVLGASGTGLGTLYGGSVNADNAADLLTLDGVDGALVGGASTNPEHFARIAAVP